MVSATHISRSVPVLTVGVQAFSMYFNAAYVAIAKPSAEDPHLQASGYAAATMIYIYAVGYCFS
jgi:hypothetical protein